MSTTPTLPAVPGAQAWLDVFEAWSGLMQGPLRSFTQPILPGWTFNIDSNNSSSPQTEADVLAKFSYGKQLGKINDALALLIAHRDAPPDAPAFQEFAEMTAQIEKAKAAGIGRRVEQVKADLKLLKKTNRREYDRLSAALRAEIDP